jgi:DNA-binding response OmpR family regulator|tara:strand:- start:516 stop:1118 length:603 start_codon:yes stop_codon:yes gene_type:complete
MNDFFIKSKSFELFTIENFPSKKIKINNEDIPLFFNSEEDLLDDFKKYLSSEGFKKIFIIFNSNKDEKEHENNKILYFTIPISFVELNQSLQNILIKNEAVEYHDLKFKKLFLNMKGGNLQDSKTAIKLTDKEAKILWHLIKEKGSIVTQSFLLNKVWGYKDDIETKTLTTHIYTIRKKVKNFNNTFSIENFDDGYCIKF